MQNKLIAAVAAALLIPAACGAPARADSLWARAEAPGNMFADTKARRTGDIVTVLIQEQLLVANAQDRNHEKETKTKFSINLFRLFGFDTPAAEQPAADWSADREHTGKGDFKSTDKMVIRLTATVKEALPNGNLLIEGTRQLDTGGETRQVCVAGIIRPEDIQADNTVLSEKIADAKILYGSRGPIVRTSSQGWAEKILTHLWPF